MAIAKRRVRFGRLDCVVLGVWRVLNVANGRESISIIKENHLNCLPLNCKG